MGEVERIKIKDDCVYIGDKLVPYVSKIKIEGKVGVPASAEINIEFPSIACEIDKENVNFVLDLTDIDYGMWRMLGELKGWL